MKGLIYRKCCRCEEILTYGKIYEIEYDTICDNCINDWIEDHTLRAEDTYEVEGE